MSTVDRFPALRAQLTGDVAHWRAAADALGDPEMFATASAWASLEQYLGLSLRTYLSDAVERLRSEGRLLQENLRTAGTEAELDQLRRSMLAYRARVIRTEVMIDYFGDAVNTRTAARITALLNACDILAVRSMAPVLHPLGHPVPPVLAYLDDGLGASILKAGLRVWDAESPSPVAAIKIVRHNLLYPTALLHETGHQVAHLTGWVDDLRGALERELGTEPAVRAWQDWASEVTADVFAFVHTGYAAIAGLHHVLAGPESAVFRYPLGDPHPIPYLRILFGLEMGRNAFGSAPGPWNDLQMVWEHTYPLDRAPEPLRGLLDRSIALLPRLVELCLNTPMRGFSNRRLVDLVDPVRVRPDRLRQLEIERNQGLDTSGYWLRQECIRLLALGGYQAATTPAQIPALAYRQEAWMLRLGQVTQAAA